MIWFITKISKLDPFQYFQICQIKMSTPGAFLTSAFVESVNPSVFEVVAQESLINTLKPAFDQIASVIAGSSPQYLSFIYKFR